MSAGPWETSADDIESLGDVSLTQLLEKLLYLEAERLGLPASSVTACLKITIPDGGEDCGIEWQGGPDPSSGDWLRRRTNVLQVKATPMEARKCGQELLRPDSNRKKRQGIDRLKQRVKYVLDMQGSYTIFVGKCTTAQQAEKAKAEMRRVLYDSISKDEADAIELNVYGAEKISHWANKYPSAVIFVLRQLGKLVLAGFQDWSSWKAEHRSLLKFHCDSERESFLHQVRKLTDTPGAIVRITGLSGLGKSRLALEAFRPADSAADVEQEARNRRCIYIDDGTRLYDQLVSTLRVFRDRKMRACVIVDECSLELHQKICEVVTEDSELSVVTLDFDPAARVRGSRTHLFTLQPFEKDYIDKILIQSTPNLPPEHVNQLSKMAQGFPRMAQLMVDAMAQGAGMRLWDLDSAETYRKLIVRRSLTPDLVFELAKAMSVLEHFGVDGDASGQFLVFCETFAPEHHHAKVYSVVKELEAAGIAYRRGDYIRITPLPLAITLAGEWWSKIPPERMGQLLTGSVLPAAMTDAMVSQLKYFGGHPVEELLKKVLGHDSPFSGRGAIFSALVPRLIDVLAEVEPSFICDYLIGQFRGMSIDDFAGFQQGRRHVVTALEKIVWWPRSFHRGAALMLKLAAGENEEWANNATGVFKQLFQIYLSGTETPAVERLEVVREGLATADIRVLQVCGAALTRAFQVSQFSRIGGPDLQAGVPREDWRPQTHKDIMQYWDSATELLQPLLLRQDEIGSEVRRRIGSRVRAGLSLGYTEHLGRQIKTVADAGISWPELVEGLRLAQTYDSSEHTDEVKGLIVSWLQVLSPTDLATRIHWYVTKGVDEGYGRGVGDAIIDVSGIRVDQLAKELSAEPEIIPSVLPGLLEGSQRQAHRFGKSLAEQISEPLAVLDQCIETLRPIRRKRRNHHLVIGLVLGLPEQHRSGARTRAHGLLSDRNSSALGLDLLRSIPPDSADLEVLLTAVRAKNLLISRLEDLVYGNCLRNIPPEDYLNFVNELQTRSLRGAGVALVLLAAHLHGRDFSSEYVEPVSKLLLQRGLLSRIMGTEGHYEHDFTYLMKKLLASNLCCPETAVDLTRLIWRVSLRDNRHTRQIREMYRDLLKAFPSDTWQTLGPLVLKTKRGLPDYRVWSTLHGLSDDALDLSDFLSLEEIAAWAAQEDRAAEWAARLITPLVAERIETEPYPSWSQAALRLLELRGDHKPMLGYLWTGMRTGVFWGSEVPRLERFKSAFEELHTHPQELVRQWSFAMSSALGKEIAEERKRDQESEFGIR